jgi:hypothetical protein
MTSFQKLYDKLEKQIQTVENALENTNAIYDKLNSTTLPKSVPSYQNKSIVAFKNSSFRNNVFQFKTYPTIIHKILECKKGEKITYQQLCRLLTQYIFSNNLFDFENNTIICDDLLKLITGYSTTTFILLLKNLGKIIN